MTCFLAIHCEAVMGASLVYGNFQKATFMTCFLAIHCKAVMGDSALELQLALSCTSESRWFCNTLDNHRQLCLLCVLQRQ